MNDLKSKTYNFNVQQAIGSLILNNHFSDDIEKWSFKMQFQFYYYFFFLSLVFSGNRLFFLLGLVLKQGNIQYIIWGVSF